MATLKYKTKDGEYKALNMLVAGGGVTPVQTTGDSETDVMSQKAVTEELNKKLAVGVKVDNAYVADTAIQTGQWVNGVASTNLDNISNIHGWANGSGAATNLPSSASAGTVISFNNSSAALQLFAGYKDTHTLYYRKKYDGAWGAWRTIIDSSNIGSYAVGGGNSVDQTARDSAEAALSTAGQALTAANNAASTATAAQNTANAALPKTGGTLTGPLTAKGEQYEGNYGLNMANSDIIGVNSIIMSDTAEAATEGIRFVNGSTHDSIWAKSGVLYFTPQMSTNHTVIHSGNVSSYAITSLSGYATQSWVQSQGYKTTDNNTLNTAGSTNSTSKLFLIGAGSQASSATTYSNSSCYMQSGYLYATSDERLKDFEGDIEVDLDVLKTLPKKYFRWKDNPEQLNIGTSAQELQKLYPELVTTDETGEMGANYQHLSVVALAAIDKLHEENLELKERIERLEKLVESFNKE